MKNVKKLLSVLLVLVLALGMLAGCGGGGDTAGSADNGGEEAAKYIIATDTTFAPF